ncbi:MAG: glycosyltransferase family 2 protein [Actinomycetota bacterium]
MHNQSQTTEERRNPDVTTTPRSSVSVVIPAKNEEPNIRPVLRGLPGWIKEVILVDGSSTDGTARAAREVRPDVVLVEEERPGKGAALRSGFSAATGDVIVMIDADGSMDPAEIERYVNMIESGDYDVVKGSRRIEGGGSTDLTAVRSIGNRCLLALANLLYGCRFTELCYGFMGFKRSSLKPLDLKADGFEIETEIVVNAVRAGLKIGEVPSSEAPRSNGCSNLHPIRDGLRILRVLLRPLVAGRRPEKSPGAHFPEMEVSPGPANGA